MSPENFDFAETVSVKQYAADQNPPNPSSGFIN